MSQKTDSTAKVEKSKTVVEKAKVEKNPPKEAKATKVEKPIANKETSKIEAKPVKEEKTAPKVESKEKPKKAPKKELAPKHKVNAKNELEEVVPTQQSIVDEKLAPSGVDDTDDALFFDTVDVKQQVDGAPKDLQKCPQCGNFRNWYVLASKEYYEIVCTPCYAKETEDSLVARVQ